MKTFKCILYMAIGATGALVYKEYENQIMCLCKKMMKKNLSEEGLDLE